MSRHFGGVGPTRPADRARSIIVLSLILLVVCSSVGVLFLYSNPNKAATQTVIVEKEPKIDMVDVLVPVQPIQAGTQLEPTMFRAEPRPKVGLASRIVRSFDEIQGYYARSLIAPEQPLHGDYITKIKPSSEITANIPPGFRAVTIRTDVRSSVEGWARPGARVDVVWATTLNGKPAIAVIVENAKILSTERQTDADIKGKEGQGHVLPSTVTLLVPASDAAKIQLASTSGSLSLSLRGDSDPGQGGQVTTINVEDLLSKGPMEPKEENYDGSLKIRGPDGKFEEYHVKNGKLIPAKK